MKKIVILLIISALFINGAKPVEKKSLPVTREAEEVGVLTGADERTDEETGASTAVPKANEERFRKQFAGINWDAEDDSLIVISKDMELLWCRSKYETNDNCFCSALRIYTWEAAVHLDTEIEGMRDFRKTIEEEAMQYGVASDQLMLWEIKYKSYIVDGVKKLPERETAYLAGFVAGRGKELYLTDMHTGTRYQFSRVGRPIPLFVLLCIIFAGAIIIPFVIRPLIRPYRTDNELENSSQHGYMAEWLYTRRKSRAKLYTITIFVIGIFAAIKNVKYGLVLFFLAAAYGLFHLILYSDDD